MFQVYKLDYICTEYLPVQMSCLRVALNNMGSVRGPALGRVVVDGFRSCSNTSVKNSTQIIKLQSYPSVHPNHPVRPGNHLSQPY